MQGGDIFIQKGLKALKTESISHAISFFQESVDRSPSADGYHMLGMAHHKNNDIRQAIDCVSEAINLSPQNSDLYLDRGQFFQTIQKIDLAEKDFSLSILLNKKNDEPYFKRGLLYLLTKQFDKAEKDFNSAIEINPKNPYFWGGLGKLFLAKKNYQKAIDTLKEALSIEPEYFDAFRMIGESYIGLNQLGEAIVVYQNCVLLDPNADGLILRLGWLYSQNSQIEPAIECFLTVVQRHPVHFDSLIGSVIQSFDKKEWEKLDKTIERKIKNANDDFYDYLTMAIVQEALNKQAIALHYYARCLKQNTSHLFSAMRLVFLSIKLNDTSVSLPLVSRLYRDHRDNPDAIYLMALLKEKCGENKEAEKLLSSAIEKSPENHLYYYQRGNIYLKKKNFDKAKEDYKSCLTFNIKFSPCFFSLSRLYGLRNRFETGLKMINLAIKYEKRAEHYVQKAKLYLGLDNLEQAKANVTKALALDENCAPAIQLKTFLFPK